MDPDIDKIMNMIIAEALMKAVSEHPTTSDIADQPNRTEKMAWIEVYDDVLDEAYDMSQEYREYD